MRNALGNIRSNLKADTTAGMPLWILLVLQVVLIAATLAWLVVGSAHSSSSLMNLAFAAFLTLGVAPVTVISTMSLQGAARKPHMDFV